MTTGEMIMRTSDEADESCLDRLLARLGMTRDLFSIAIMGLGFCLIWTAYNTTQDFASHLLGNDVGPMSIFIIYAVMAVANLLASKIVRVLNPRIGLVLGGACYVFFMVAQVIRFSLGPSFNWLVYVGSAVLGTGGAVIWCSNGVIITECSTEANRGQMFSVFWAFFSASLCTVR